MKTPGERFAPIQVYVSRGTAEVWAKAERVVAERRKTDPRYSMSRFVTEAVKRELDPGEVPR